MTRNLHQIVGDILDHLPLPGKPYLSPEQVLRQADDAEITLLNEQFTTLDSTTQALLWELGIQSLIKAELERRNIP